MFHKFKLLGTEANLNFDIHLDPGKRFYCLFGKNGVGKTTLLRVLTRTLIAQHSMLQMRKEGLEYSGLFMDAKILESLKDRSLWLPEQIEIEGKVVKDRKTQSWSVTQLEKLNASSLLSRAGLTYAEDSLLISQPVMMVGTARRGHSDRLEENKLSFVGDTQKEFLNAFNRTWSAATDDILDTQGPAAWIASRLLVNPNFVVGASNRVQEVIALFKLLTKLDPITFKNWLTESDKGIQLAINFKDGKLWFGQNPVDKLATGYVAVVKILQEIISTLSAWAGGNTADEILSHEGIALIDELEAHLHPQWQIRIVQLLKEFFPKVTFLVGTHSPLVVAQTNEGEAYELVRDERSVTSRRLGNPRDWYLADVYADAFHIILPAPGTASSAEEPSLIEVFLNFSNEVKNYVGRREESLRERALELHKKLDGKLSTDDPRRRSLDSLRSMLG